MFTKSEMCCCAETVLMQVLEEHLDIQNHIFQIEGAMTERMIAWVSFSPRVTVEGRHQINKVDY